MKPSCEAERTFKGLPGHPSFVTFGPCIKPEGHKSYHKDREGWGWLSSRQERERLRAQKGRGAS